MKLGISTYLWAAPFTAKDIGLIEKAHKLGFDAIELPVTAVDEIDPAAIKRECERFGMEPVLDTALSPDQDLVHTDPEVRARGQKYLRDCIDAVARMGAQLLVGPICVAPGRMWMSDEKEKQAALERLTAAVRPVAKYAGDHGVKLAFEPLSRHEACFLNRIEDALQLVQAVDSPAFGLNPDTYHLNIEEKSIGAAIERAGSHIFNFHACENDRGTPGSGHMPWKEIAAALKKINYQGIVIIESFTHEVEFLARAVSVWRPIEPSMDGLAGDGLTFLRKTLA